MSSSINLDVPTQAHFFDIEDMVRFAYRRQMIPREGETVVVKRLREPAATAFTEYTVREVVWYQDHDDVFVLCVKRRDARRASARMHQLLEAIK